MNSAIVEYIEGIEVIKAFGRAGVSYEKYAKSITDFRTFVVKWLSSTWVTMKLAFALFPSTLIGTLPMSLWLAEKGILTTPQAALAVSCCPCPWWGLWPSWKSSRKICGRSRLRWKVWKRFLNCPLCRSLLSLQPFPAPAWN